MSKKMRMLQILNLWRLISAYLIVCISNNKAIIFEEIQHWKNAQDVLKSLDLIFLAV